MRSLIDFALLLAPFAAAFLLTALLTPLVRGAALAAGRVSPARDDRWHTRPTPILGGVAIFVGFGITVVAAVLLNPEAMAPLRFAHRGILPWSPWEGLLAAGITVFLVGLADDFVGLRPMRKLAGQLVAASILVMSGIGVWLTGIFVIDAILSVFWFVAITNALNLLDSMDGVAAGVGLIAALFLSVLFLMDFHVGLAYISMALAGALLGFLIYNYPPAKIFMGDSGSLFIGLFLAGLALSPTPGASRSLLAVVVIPLLVLAIPILDTTLVTVSRVLERRPISEGGRDHASHRLVSLGVSETRALWILWVLAAVGGGVGLLVRTAERTSAVLLGGLLLAFLTVVGMYLLHVRFRALKQADEGAGSLYERLVTLHERYPVLTFVFDALVVTLAYFAAYLIRWEQPELANELVYFRLSLPVVLAVKLAVFAWAGAYTHRWTHFSLDEGFQTVRANVLATVGVVVALLLLERIGLSRTVLALDLLLCTILMMGTRLSFRLMEGAAQRWSKEGIPAIVVGSLQDAEVALRELQQTEDPKLRPVAVVDRRFGKPKGSFRGYPLFGGRDALEEAMKTFGAEAVVLIRRRGDVDEEEAKSLEGLANGPQDAKVYVLNVSLEPVEPG